MPNASPGTPSREKPRIQPGVAPVDFAPSMNVARRVRSSVTLPTAFTVLPARLFANATWRRVCASSVAGSAESAAVSWGNWNTMIFCPFSSACANA